MKIIIIFALICSLNACPDGWYPSLVDASKCYFVSQQRMSWQDAANFCHSFSNLTSVLSTFETNELNAQASNNPLIGSNDQVWIGALGIENDEKFIWLDGNLFVYTNWLAGQPNLMYPCVSTLARSSGRWRTEPCETQNYFICRATFQPASTPTDCFDWRFNNNGNSTDGVYRISPPGIDPFDVWCDMTTAGGGWIVIQKRTDTNESLSFQDKTWIEYKNGFNNGLNNSMWLGNDKIHDLSSKDSNVDLRFDLWGNCYPFYDWSFCPDSSSNSSYWFGTFTSFQLDNEDNKYTFHVSNSSSVYPLITNGNASIITDSMGLYYNSGKPFSTFDAQHGASSCDKYQGGWWIDDCTYVDLNGDADGHASYNWHTQEIRIELSRSSMMLRKNNNALSLQLPKQNIRLI